jgi:MobA/MobL family
MANFHYDLGGFVSRGAGKGVVAAAAYMNRETFRDERTGVVHDYRSRAHNTIAEAAAYISRSDVQGERQPALFIGLYAPDGAPDWCRGAENTERFWNAAEKAERHPNAQIAERVIIALPHELTLQQNIWLLQDHIRDFTRQGRVVHVAIHAPEHDEKRNIHAHLLISTRGVDENGLKRIKYTEQGERYLNRKDYVSGIRERWAAVANRHLERHAHAARIDHRSLKDRGIEREPNIHLGPAAAAKERRGERTELGDRHRAIQARNAEREQARREIAGLEGQIAAIDRAAAHRHDPREEADRFWQHRAHSQHTDIATLQRAHADRVPSGWRNLTVEDVARELSPAYAEKLKTIERLQEEISKASFVINHRERDIRGANYQRQQRWEQMGLTRKALHKLGWHDRKIDEQETTARRASYVSERRQIKRSALAGELRMAERGAARELEKVRPEAEALLATWQQTAATARQEMQEQRDREREHEAQQRAQQREQGWER